MTKREFIQALGFCGAAGLAGCKGLVPWLAEKGIPIGVITYSYAWMQPRGPFKALEHTLASGLKTMELMYNDLEIDAGCPFNEKDFWNRLPESKEAISEWRGKVSMDTFRAVKARYDMAGMDVHIVKYGDIDGRMSDKDLDYRFEVTKIMGANVITREVPDPKNIPDWIEKSGRRLARFAEKWGVDIAFHNHLQIDKDTYAGPLLDVSERFKINFDIGHYTAANDDDPLDIVRRFHDRIASIHLKDRTTKIHGQQNLAFGTGDTPLAGLFELLVDEGWKIPCDIELEYKIPKGSDAEKEVAVCREFCEKLIG